MIMIMIIIIIANIIIIIINIFIIISIVYVNCFNWSVIVKNLSFRCRTKIYGPFSGC